MKRGNTVSIKGNITKDMEVRRTNSGANACSWGIAWNDSRKNENGDWEDVPNFFEIQCWASDGQLKFLEGVKKGARCAVVGGHLEQQSWTKDGNKYSRVVIRVDDPVSGLMVEAPRSKRGNQTEQFVDGSSDVPPILEATVYDEDIPF